MYLFVSNSSRTSEAARQGLSWFLPAERGHASSHRPLLPDSVAGGVQTDYLSIGICVGHIRAGFVANQTRALRCSSDDDPCEAGDLAWKDLVSQRRAWWEFARGHEKADPNAQLAVIHTS